MQRAQERQPNVVPVPQERNWKLISFRGIVLIGFVICLSCVVNDTVYYASIVNYYLNTPGCDFLKFEIVSLVGCLILICILLLGFGLVLYQNLKPLRIYLTVLAVSSFLDLMVTLVLTQSYPLVHDIHKLWENGQSLSKYETTYKCCGALGPDDYLLTFGELPASCFANDNRSAASLNSAGCLNKSITERQLLQIELITPLILRKKVAKRNCRTLWKEKIFF
ncbi:uncharacterized protein LOC111593203 isoform X2 [Drosophila hydei]|uniref:Uncharacterized protein LOC111593203 isoform X2 n=1 Tax=Drosophila hydei TaxID=7224 RepID=A0A6J1L560_DROHY|nr:uncharacterized protein LOC111593203 isoform X2 [Drosophila hydei]